MKRPIRIPVFLQEKVVRAPEHRPDGQIGIVHLRNGTHFNVLITRGEWIPYVEGCLETDDPPFAEDDILDIEVTNKPFWKGALFDGK